MIIENYHRESIIVDALLVYLFEVVTELSIVFSHDLTSYRKLLLSLQSDIDIKEVFMKYKEIVKAQNIKLSIEEVERVKNIYNNILKIKKIVEADIPAIKSIPMFDKLNIKSEEVGLVKNCTIHTINSVIDEIELDQKIAA